MKVLLTHGYFLHEDRKEQQIMRPYPPLGLLSISAYLSEKQLENTVFDTTFYRKTDLWNILLAQKPEIVGIYTNLMTKLNVLEIIKYIRRISSDTKIVLGGPDVTFNVENYLKNGADFLVIGEGEVTMFELIRALNDHLSIHEVDGIAFLDGSGKLIQTNPRSRLKPIDELPVPDREAVDITRYMDIWKKYHGQSALNVSTQRGCPYTCKWCSTAVYGQSYRRRSPKEVIRELLDIRNTYNPDTIWFVDDVFTVSHKWLNEMAAEMAKNNLHIPFECITRADRMNNEVISTLKKMGCFRIWIGAESGSQKVIDAMDRRISVHWVREMIRETRKQGIEAGTFIMLGYPGETEKDIKETIHHLKVAEPDQFTITLAYPIKGTALYEEVKPVMDLPYLWAESTDRDIDFKRTYNRTYYRYAIPYVTNQVKYAKHIKQYGFDLYASRLKIISVLASLKMKWHKHLK